VRTLSGCSVYLDDADALQYYAVPESPHIALDAQGKPVFSLVQYRRPVDKVAEADRATKLGGGLLTFSVDLSRSAAQDDEIRKTLAADPALHALLATAAADQVDYSDWWNNQIHQDVDKLAAALRINALPVEDGSVAVAIDGEDETHAGEFLTTLVGAGKVSMTGDERAAFMAKLTMDGAALIWEMVQKNLTAIWVGYKLSFTSRLDGVKMICHCDTVKLFNALQSQWQHLSESGSARDEYTSSSETHTYDHAQTNSAGNVLTKFAMDTESAFVKVIPTAGPDVIKPDMIAQLTNTGWTMITQYLADTLLQATNPADFTTKDDPTLQTQLADAGGGRKYGADNVSAYSLKQVDETTIGDFNVTFDEKATITSSADPTDNLANVLDGHDVKDFCAQIDLDPQFFHYADVQITCTTDFAKEPVDAVKVHMEYHGTAHQGPINEVKDFEFTKADSAPKTFSTYIAAPDQDSYTYSVEVFYSGSTKTYSFIGKSNETELVLDTDTLGVLSVDVQAGLVDWTRYTAAQVALSYGDGATGVNETITLTGEKQIGSWVAVLGTKSIGAYDYSVTWVDTTDQQIKSAPQSSHGRRIVIDQPLQQSMNIMVIPVGSFGGDGLMHRIVTALRYEDPAHHYEQTATATFAAETDSQIWTVPLLDTNLRTYQYQANVLYSDGVTRIDPSWTTSDQTVLTVGDKYGYRVQFIPLRLGSPPGKWTLATLHVEFSDPQAKIAVSQDFSIDDFTKPVFWRFRMDAQDRHTYTYQLTLFSADASQAPLALPTVTDSRQVVVLEPTA
jgi:hypothetical protein